MTVAIRRLALLLAIVLGAGQNLAAGDRLLTTADASQLEDAAGGDLGPCGAIAGYGNNEQIGDSAFASQVSPASSWNASRRPQVIASGHQ